MVKKFWYILGIGGFIFLFVPFLAKAQDDQITLIQFRNETAKANFLKSNPSAKESKIPNLVKLQAMGSLKSWWLELKSNFNDDVEYVETGHKIKSSVSPNDTYYSSQWGLSKINASQGWDITDGDASKSIAIIDTGVQIDHPDLVNKIKQNSIELAGIPGVDDDGNDLIDDINGWDFYDSDNTPSGDISHGTIMAGIAGAQSNNGQGVAGVDWQAKILPVKVWSDSCLDPDCTTDPDIVALGIRYAADQGADVINMSLGSDSDWTSMRNAVSYAYGLGSVLVAATGNDYADVANYPARYDHVIGVGSINSNGQLSSFTNTGIGLDIVAPGENIRSTTIGSSYVVAGAGTSLSTSFVSGAVSLLLDTQPNLTPDQVEAKIKNLGESVSDYNIKYLNLWKSLQIKLIKTASSNAYLIDGTKRYTLWNSSAFWQRFGFSTNFVETVDDATLNSYQDGGYLTGLWANGSNTYYIDNGQKFQVWPSVAFFSRWGFYNSDKRNISSALLAQFNTIGWLTGLIKGNSSSQVYFIDRAKKYPIWPSAAFYARFNFHNSDLRTLSQAQVNSIPTAPALTGLIRGQTKGMVYLVDKGVGRPIMSMGIFNQWGWHSGDISFLSDGFVNSFAKNSFVTRLINDGQFYYWINDGSKHRITEVEKVFSNHDWSFADVGHVSSGFMSAFPSGDDLAD